VKVPSVPEPIVGFYTTRFVNARDKGSAIEIAKEKVLAEWKVGDYHKSNIGSLPRLEIEEVKKIGFVSSLFSRHPRNGYTFFSND